MAKVSMKALLESGVHFGHRTHRWHPQMRPYIFTERNGIHIIDLQQTVKAMEEVGNVVSQTVANGGSVLFVGTKRQAVETIEEEAKRCGMPYVTFRWLGGMLTNWFTMRQRINELDRLERMREKGEFDLLTKKEGLMLSRKIEKLLARFGGIRKMHRLPDLIFIVDVRREETAVREANSLGIPIVALVDTNCDPRMIDYVIPSNDDAIRTIKLMVGFIADAVEEGRAMRKDEDVEDIVVTAPAAADLEEELSDEELLGASTLAKMEAEAAAEAEAAEAEEIEEVVTEADEVEEAETELGDETAEENQAEADAEETDEE
ncbi:MAG: 30S ribosomal protein S2 [Anaerolineales bacterium]|nr:30S ribosomal protein S2 [Anaerolineales bacterium]